MLVPQTPSAFGFWIRENLMSGVFKGGLQQIPSYAYDMIKAQSQDGVLKFPACEAKPVDANSGKGMSVARQFTN